MFMVGIARIQEPQREYWIVVKLPYSYSRQEEEDIRYYIIITYILHLYINI